MKKKEFEKTATISLSILGKAKNDDWERYEAALICFSNFLFQENAGMYNGRETAIINKPKKNEKEKTTFWFVLESKQKLAINKLKKIIKNFNLSDVTTFTNGIPQKETEDYKKIFEKRKKFSWDYTKH